MTDAPECWLSIAGFEGIYEVSDLGRVRSLDRMEPWMDRTRRRRGCVLRTSPGEYGHLTVNLYRNGVARHHGVHRLVLEAFVGPCPEGMEGCHVNSDPGDNRLENLKWDTPKNNQAESHRLGRAYFSRVKMSPVHAVVAELADELRSEGSVELADVFERLSKKLLPRPRE